MATSDPGTWQAVDAFIGAHLLPPDPGLDAALADAESAGLPAIAVSPPQGALLDILARAVGARSAVEIGTLGGYSAIWLGRALGPGGRLVSLEREARHAEVARANLARSGLTDVVEVRVGQALDLLPDLLAEVGEGAVDLFFADADKASNPDYFAWGLRLVRPGGLILVDNVVRGGAVIDLEATDQDTAGTRRLFEVVGAEPRVRATAIQTVGAKGHDGLLVALVIGPPVG